MKLLNLLILTFLFSCSDNSSYKPKSQERSKNIFQIDTLINDYQVHVKLGQAHFLKEIENEIAIQIDNVSDSNLILYTKTKEATIKFNNDKSGFLVFPTRKANSVTIYLNVQKEGRRIPIGNIKIKTE